ncbi:MAG TPA: AtpZ/AtpI family protein, partial [Gemmatimonadales bacterium]
KYFTRIYVLAGPDPKQPGGTGPGPARYAGLGIQFAGTILVFVLLGQWADRKMGTAGLFTILGAFLALGGTMFSLFRALKNDNGDQR